ncbi:vacuolar membrane protein-domain-containing protein [Crepidotus variabilis]|uniref:Vacuolar membrane protein-domain-containing protein n=1 Tax=Crepidotus variabilis TaxID=179855 RepID=A0A9P6ERW3_9AGAR|nr:vacuolar membrane protein-domain-containing protein [Crepidotus variabilis]
MSGNHDIDSLTSATRIAVPDVDKHSCQLLGPTALVVQALMGVMVVLSLVYKRHRESPKRPWRIWIFDISKQVVGQLFVHAANLLVSGLASQHTSANACVSYFLNILIDTTLGVALIYFTLHALNNILTEKLHLKGFESGIYGEPPSANYWFRQAAVYILSLSTMKVVVITLLLVFPGIYKFGEWLLSWTWLGGSEDDFQVIFVMGFFPILMNIIQFWLIDSIVKASSIAGVALDIENDGGHHDREPLFNAEDDDDEFRPSLPEQHRRRTSASSYDSRGYQSHDDQTSNTSVTTPNEIKQSSPKLVDSHAYPPSLSSSMVSNVSTSQDKPPRIAKNLIKKSKRRDAPTPIPESISVSGPSSLSHTHTAPPLTNTTIPTNRQSSDWGANWDDANDWDHSNSVGNEDWKASPQTIQLQT